LITVVPARIAPTALRRIGTLGGRTWRCDARRRTLVPGVAVGALEARPAVTSSRSRRRVRRPFETGPARTRLRAADLHPTVRAYRRIAHVCHTSRAGVVQEV
jgi:hypothetical protein